MNSTNQGQVKVNVTFNLFNLKKTLEIMQGREYSWAEIARRAGLHRNTIDRIAANQTSRTDLKTISGLLGFFLSEGMDISLNDLFHVETVKND